MQRAKEKQEEINVGLAEENSAKQARIEKLEKELGMMMASGSPEIVVADKKNISLTGSNNMKKSLEIAFRLADESLVCHKLCMC